MGHKYITGGGDQFFNSFRANTGKIKNTIVENQEVDVQIVSSNIFIGPYINNTYTYTQAGADGVTFDTNFLSISWDPDGDTRSGLILNPPTVDGQNFFLTNVGAVGENLVFAVSGTSNVSGGVSVSIPSGATGHFVGYQDLWYNVGGGSGNVSVTLDSQEGANNVTFDASSQAVAWDPDGSTRTGLRLTEPAVDGQVFYILNIGNASEWLVFVDGVDIGFVASGSGAIIRGGTVGQFVAYSGLWYLNGSNSRDQVEDPSTLSGYADIYLVTTTTPTSCTLSDLSREQDAGHITYIRLVSDGGNFTITPTSFINGTSLILDDAGDYAVFEWSGEAWFLKENQSGNAPTEPSLVDESDLISSVNVDFMDFRDVRQYSEGNIRIFESTLQVSPTSTSTATQLSFALPKKSGGFPIGNFTDAVFSINAFRNTGDPSTMTAIPDAFGFNASGSNRVFINFTSSASAGEHSIQVVIRYAP